MKVRLVTNDGGLVTEGTIPPFNQPPEVILWGVRVFKLQADVGELFDEPAVYKEAFAFYLT